MIKTIIFVVGILLIETFCFPIPNNLQRVINARNSLTPLIIANGMAESVPPVEGEF